MVRRRYCVTIGLMFACVLAGCADHDEIYRYLLHQRENNGASQLLCAEFDAQAEELPTSEVARLGNHAARIGGVEQTLFPHDGSTVQFGDDQGSGTARDGR